MSLESLYNEHLLIEAMQAGSEPAFTALYRHYSPQLYLNILGIVRDPLWAEEMVQELFTRIWQKRDSKGLQQNFRGYIYRMSQHLVHDFFRRVQRDRKVQERFKALASQHYSPVEDGVNNMQLKGLLQEAVDRLSPQQKKAYRLIRVEGHTYKQAAEIMGISPLTIKEYLTNSHKLIRSYIIHHTGGEVWSLLFLLFLSFSL